MSVSDIYAKMLQDPKNRVRTHIKQPTPFDKGQNITNEVKEEMPSRTEEISEAEKSYLDELDKRMAMRSAGKKIASKPDKIQILENRIIEVENALKMIMDTHMKLVKKLEKS